MTITGYGAFICVTVPDDGREALAAAPVDALVTGLGLHNDFDGALSAGTNTVAFLRRVGATAGQTYDDGVLSADVVIHVFGTDAENRGHTSGVRCLTPIARLLNPAATVRVLHGIIRPTNYTGGLMHEFAYAHQLSQQPGAAMPHAFLLPMSKTPEWWAKDWMERHTYFLPRYEHGRMVNQGHVLAAAGGIPHLMRRTYRNATEPAPAGEYDFLTYFECADAGVPVFHQVLASLRDTSLNPEWAFVREGPLWHGQRVRCWREAVSREP